MHNYIGTGRCGSVLFRNPEAEAAPGFPVGQTKVNKGRQQRAAGESAALAAPSRQLL